MLRAFTSRLTVAALASLLPQLTPSTDVFASYKCATILNLFRIPGDYGFSEIVIIRSDGIESRYSRRTRFYEELVDEGAISPVHFNLERINEKNVLVPAMGTGMLVHDLRPHAKAVMGVDIFLSESQTKAPWYRKADFTSRSELEAAGFQGSQFDIIADFFGLNFYHLSQKLPANDPIVLAALEQSNWLLKPRGHLIISPIDQDQLQRLSEIVQESGEWTLAVKEPLPRFINRKYGETWYYVELQRNK